MSIENIKEAALDGDSTITSMDKIRMVGSDGKSYTTSIDAIATYINSLVNIPVDDTLSTTGVSADAKKTGDEIARVEALANKELVIPADFAQALIECFQHVSWRDTEGQLKYDALVNILQ